MEKTYKSSVFRMVLNFFMGIAAAGVVFFIASIWLEQTYAIGIAVFIFLSYLWLVVWSNIITITVTDEYLTVRKGKKTKSFKIRECSFYAKVTSSNGDTGCSLTVLEANGNEEYIDCELIGYSQFQNLLMDLGITGENAPVNKIKTKKGV